MKIETFVWLRDFIISALTLYVIFYIMTSYYGLSTQETIGLCAFVYISKYLIANISALLSLPFVLFFVFKNVHEEESDFDLMKEE